MCIHSYTYYVWQSGIAITRVHGWRIMERALDIEVCCEQANLTNKQSHNNSGIAIRVRCHGAWLAPVL